MTKTVSGYIFAPRMVIARRSRNVRELFSPMMHRRHLRRRCRRYCTFGLNHFCHFAINLAVRIARTGSLAIAGLSFSARHAALSPRAATETEIAAVHHYAKRVSQFERSRAPRSASNAFGEPTRRLRFCRSREYLPNANIFPFRHLKSS